MSMLNHELNLIFCHEPYTGGRSFSEALKRSGGQWFDFNGEHHILPSHMESKGFIGNFEDYFTFRFVRHPVEWLASYWWHGPKNKPFYAWVFEDGPSLMQNDMLFWRYEGCNETLKMESDLQRTLDFMHFNFRFKRVRIKHIGLSGRPAISELICQADLEKLPNIYPEIEKYDYPCNTK